ncbi:MAG: flavin reductase family protein [Acidimicrobiales bacterium]
MPISRSSDAADAMVARVDYPMFVVTVADGGEASGCLAGFVTQCSIEPARFLVCISKENHTFPVAARASGLGLHLLGADQQPMAALFGELTGDRIDKLALVDWRPGRSGAPVLPECAAWVEGRILSRVDLGDHVGHLIEVVDGGAGSHRGQLDFTQVTDLDPGHPVGGG